MDIYIGTMVKGVQYRVIKDSFCIQACVMVLWIVNWIAQGWIICCSFNKLRKFSLLPYLSAPATCTSTIADIGTVDDFLEVFLLGAGTKWLVDEGLCKP